MIKLKLNNNISKVKRVSINSLTVAIPRIQIDVLNLIFII